MKIIHTVVWWFGKIWSLFVLHCFICFTCFIKLQKLDGSFCSKKCQRYFLGIFFTFWTASLIFLYFFPNKPIKCTLTECSINRNRYWDLIFSNQNLGLSIQMHSNNLSKIGVVSLIFPGRIQSWVSCMVANIGS